MSTWLIWAITAGYMYSGMDLYLKGNSGHGIMFMSYALANLGILMTMGAL